MAVSLHWTHALYRMGSQHHKYGAPYDTVGTVIRVGQVAYIEGHCCRRPTNAERRDLATLLRAEGVHTVVWVRKRDQDHEARLRI